MDIRQVIKKSNVIVQKSQETYKLLELEVKNIVFNTVSQTCDKIKSNWSNKKCYVFYKSHTLRFQVIWTNTESFILNYQNFLLMFETD